MNPAAHACWVGQNSRCDCPPTTTDALVGGEGDTSFGQPSDGCRIDNMLDAQHALGEVIGGIASQDRHAAMVEHRRHEMHSAAMRLHAGGQRLRVGVQSRKGRQQRRVDIDQPTTEVRHEAWR